MYKRRRVYGPRAKRSIDKRVVSVKQSSVGASNVTTVLATVTTPCTVLGIRWSFYVQGDAGTAGNAHDYVWAIIRAREGATLPTLNTTDAATFYTPEQDVLAFGAGTSRQDAAGDTDNPGNRWNGKSGSKRKLMIGDRVIFVANGIATETVRVEEMIQLFCMT